MERLVDLHLSKDLFSLDPDNLQLHFVFVCLFYFRVGNIVLLFVLLSSRLTMQNGAGRPEKTSAKEVWAYLSVTLVKQCWFIYFNVILIIKRSGHVFLQELLTVWEAMSNTWKNVSSDFQTPRSWLKRKSAAPCFPNYLSVFGNRIKHSSSFFFFFFP